MVWANSPAASAYESVFATEFSINLGEWSLSDDLRHWIDEGLMAIFFFVIGLEVRHELSVGELTDRLKGDGSADRRSRRHGDPRRDLPADQSQRRCRFRLGSGTATDTAFVLGALALVGPRAPTQLRIFLLTLAIVDDIVAITIIGLFYSEALDPVALAVAALCLVLIAMLPRLRIWQTWAYLAVGLVLWVAAFESGLHPTLAGMLAGLLVVSRPPEKDEVEDAARTARAFGSRRCPRSAEMPAGASSGRSPRTSASRGCCCRWPVS